MQSIPPTTADKQTQAQKRRGSRSRKLLGAKASFLLLLIQSIFLITSFLLPRKKIYCCWNSLSPHATWKKCPDPLTHYASITYCCNCQPVCGLRALGLCEALPAGKAWRTHSCPLRRAVVHQVHCLHQVPRVGIRCPVGTCHCSFVWHRE